jgi:cyclohexanone monooxygenase
MSNAQAGFTANFPHLSNEQAKHIAYIIDRGTQEKVQVIEATAEGEQAWLEQCISRARDTRDFFEKCTPGYYNNEGKVGDLSAQNGFYGGGSIEFFKILEAWREAGVLDGLERR